MRGGPTGYWWSIPHWKKTPKIHQFIRSWSNAFLLPSRANLHAIRSGWWAELYSASRFVRWWRWYRWYFVLTEWRNQVDTTFVTSQNVWKVSMYNSKIKSGSIARTKAEQRKSSNCRKFPVLMLCFQLWRSNSPCVPRFLTPLRCPSGCLGSICMRCLTGFV